MEELGPADLKQAVVTYRDLLRSHQDRINRLNVYPVPDGDTGTNMALTLESVVAELDGATDMASVAKAMSHGSLMGARGNSGVILSQVLRGLADGLNGSESASASDVKSALDGASVAAYGAVMRPVEGTILTVVKAAAAGAAEGDTLVGVLDAARDGAAEALANTPEQLPVLKQAGVVDAGGAGFLLFLDALLNVADGRPLPEPPPSPEHLAGTLHPPVGSVSASASLEGLRYEVMYLLDASDETIPAFKNVWAGIGDSIVVVGGDGLWNCHIHTDDIGAAVEAALDAGRPRNIRVTDLMEQVEEERWVREHEAEPEGPAQHVPTAVVAVATGAGLQRIFRSLGVQRIVAGGQSMNPSTAEILEAVNAAAADEVVILPNNKNIIAVAEQVDELTAKRVRVVKTTDVAEGFAALMEYDPEASADDNVTSMTTAKERIVCGEITRSVRASTCDVGPVAEGDWLGMSEDTIIVVAPTLGDATCGLLAKLVTDDHEIVTVIEGDGATAGETRRISEWIGEHRAGASVEVHHGGQPLYPYLFSVE
ncbi:MAG TPA: DAK2 domain-containing protein [Acidimicrobiales bacterium]|nr:DAK2 domain-containing protein [Acidimicrobiales bacterium]